MLLAAKIWLAIIVSLMSIDLILGSLLARRQSNHAVKTRHNLRPIRPIHIAHHPHHKAA